MEPKVRPEYASLITPLSEKEYQQLKQSIQEYGVYIPVVVNSSNEILDGHHRARVCKELGIEVPTILRRSDDPLLEKKFVIESNLKRRHLSDFQKVELGRLLEPIEAELAQRRMKAGTLASDGAKGKTAEKVAEKVGLSTRTYERGKVVVEKAPEDLKEQVRSGVISISAAYDKTLGKEKLKKERVSKDFLVLPSSLFEQASAFIDRARASGADKVRLLHDDHQVIEVAS